MVTVDAARHTTAGEATGSQALNGGRGLSSDNVP